MADKKISQLPLKSVPTGNEEIPFAYNGANGKLKASSFIPDLSGYITREETLETYQPKGDYLTEAEASKTYQKTGNYITAETANEAYQPKGDYLTTAAANSTYQPKGSYVTEKVASETYQPKGDYLTEEDLPAPVDAYTKEESDARYMLKDSDVTALFAYGIEFDTTISSPTCTRIGNMSMHRTLPVQSLMRGCLLADDGTVNTYLPSDSWADSVRDGSAGQVMVEIPEHYIKFETDGTKRRVWLSTTPISGFIHKKKCYVSAYEAAVQRSTTTLCSVVNLDADFRGGNNNASYDEGDNTLLGRPATSISRTNFRAYARKRKSDSTEWNCMTYDIQKTLYWLFVVEYATLNSQASYNAELTSEGYRQGGLGAGVTELNNSLWNTWSGLNPFVPCGYTDSLGNNTGVVPFKMPAGYSSDIKTTNVPRYHGIENPFGHVWQWTDGINVRISPTEANGGDGLSKVYVCSDPSKFKDNGYDGYSHVGNEARAEGYVKQVIFGEYGEIMPQVAGGGSTTYHCDYHYTNIPTAETLRGVLFGGNAPGGATAGFAYAYSNNAPSNANAYIGSRLCFLPA